MIRWTIPAALFGSGTKPNTVNGLSKTVSQDTNWTLHSRKIRENGQNGYMWSYRSLCGLLWYAITQIQRYMGHIHHQRLYSTANIQLVPIFSDFFEWATVRDVYRYHIPVLYPYNGTCVYLYVYAWVLASYTVPQPTYALSKTVPARHVPPWNGVYTTRDSPVQPHMIVVIDKKLLKVERAHRATRWCNMVGIQRIYGTVHVPDCRLGIYTIFFFFNLWV